MGVGYGTRNLGKVMGPLGLALIVGISNYVHPQATLDAIVPALLYLAFWYGQAGVAFWLLGIETKDRISEEIEHELTYFPAVLMASPGTVCSVIVMTMNDQPGQASVMQ